MPPKQITSATLNQSTVQRLDRQRACMRALHDRRYSRSELIEAALEDFIPGEFAQWLLNTAPNLDELPLVQELALDLATRPTTPLGNSLSVWVTYLRNNKAGPDAFEALREAHECFLLGTGQE